MSNFFAVIVALIHGYVFFLESISWGSPGTNRLFRVGAEDARTLQKMAFNQGFYNLFLTLAIAAGFVLVPMGRAAEGQAMLIYANASVFGAGLVLFASDRKLVRPALIQALPALAFLVARASGY